MDVERTWKLVMSDKVQKKFGSVVREIAGKSARFEQIERLLPKLKNDQFKMLVTIAEGMVKSNRN